MDQIGMAGLMGIVLISTVGCAARQDETDASRETTTDAVEHEERFALEEGFTQLSLDNFHFFPKPEVDKEPVWRAREENIISCSGLQRGYAYTNKVYGNFTLRLDFRYPTVNSNSEKPPNTGFLIYMPAEQKVWPASLEVQGRQDEIGQIKSNSKDLSVDVIDDEQARTSSRHGLGKWNRIEIISRDGALTSYLNGTKISESKPTELQSGFIGLQSEGFEVEFRRLRIREE